jgi:hypothetical protein
MIDWNLYHRRFLEKTGTSKVGDGVLLTTRLSMNPLQIKKKYKGGKNVGGGMWVGKM